MSITQAKFRLMYLVYKDYLSVCVCVCVCVNIILDISKCSQRYISQDRYKFLKTTIERNIIFKHLCMEIRSTAFNHNLSLYLSDISKTTEGNAMCIAFCCCHQMPAPAISAGTKKEPVRNSRQAL